MTIFVDVDIVEDVCIYILYTHDLDKDFCNMLTLIWISFFVYFKDNGCEC